MKFVALVSGGKDSLYAILLAKAAGHELVGCVHLAAPVRVYNASASHNNNGDEPEESYMYQTAASEAVQCQVQDCMDVPFFSYPRTGTSLHTSLVYPPSLEAEAEPSPLSQQPQQHDEVQDLYEALRHAQTCLLQSHSITVQAVCCGAILSNYQRVRVEDVVCRRLQLTSLAYAWRKASPTALLTDMLGPYAMRVVFVKTAAPPGLLPRTHLGHELHTLHDHLLHCHNHYQLQICGEGGEYETLVLDCPLLFTQGTLSLDQVQIQLDPHDNDIGTLSILKCHAEPRPTKRLNATDESGSGPGPNNDNSHPSNVMTSTTAATLTMPPSVQDNASGRQHLPRHNGSDCVMHCWMPHIRRVSGGLWSVSELQCYDEYDQYDQYDHFGGGGGGRAAETDVVLHQAHSIFAMLQRILQSYQCTAHDVVMVHIYLSDMNDFARINTIYAHFFGSHLPPSRSTVAVTFDSTAAGKHHHQPQLLRLDCIVQCGSGMYMRFPTHSNLAASNTNDDDDDDTNQHSYAMAAQVSSSVGGPKLRDVLHVQSRSHWAPVCVGPYSQVNTLRESVHFLAGQIGLVPSTMQLRSGSWTDQLKQSWINVANVLDALDAASIEPHTLSCLIYFSSSAVTETDDRTTIAGQMAKICRAQIESNGGVVPGHVEGMVLIDSEKKGTDDTGSSELLWGGYEDEETQREIEGDRMNAQTNADPIIPPPLLQTPCPILMVEIAQMPVGALTEIEIVAVSRRTASCFGGLCTLFRSPTTCVTAVGDLFDCTPLGWDAGHEFPVHTTEEDSFATGITIDASFRCLGVNPATTSTTAAKLSFVSSALVAATCVSAHQASCGQQHALTRMIDPRAVLREMLAKLAQEPSFDHQSVLHLRLYYSTKFSRDLVSIRSALDMAMGAIWTSTTIPAVTVIPVSDMLTLFHKGSSDGDDGSCTDKPFLAFQALSIDPVSMEQAIWIHQKR